MNSALVLCEQIFDFPERVQKARENAMEAAASERGWKQLENGDWDAGNGVVVNKSDAVGDWTKIELPRTRVKPQDEWFGLYLYEGIVAPPYDPKALTQLVETTNILGPLVEAYEMNIDGHGHTLKPLIDLKNEAERRRVKLLIKRGFVEVGDDGVTANPKTEQAEEASERTEGITQSEVDQEDEGLEAVDKDPELEKKIRILEEEMERERVMLENFFENANPEISFTMVRRVMRRDKEVTGNGYWEILRNPDGIPTAIYPAPSWSMALTRADDDWTQAWTIVREDKFRLELKPYRRRFRRYVQYVEGRFTYFKEYGDPRLINALDGRVIADVTREKDEKTGETKLIRKFREGYSEDSLKEGGNFVEASEIVHFKHHVPRSPYGIPRYMGVLMAMMGSRAAEEVNYTYFDNKGVPPLAIVVEDGKMSKSSVESISAFIKSEAKGIDKFHDILVLESAAEEGFGAGTGRARIRFENLRNSQEKDAQFLEYDNTNREKARVAFRLPQMFIGISADFNRSTSETMKLVAEEQVFGPERREFDDWMNRRLLTEMNINYWKFESQPPPMGDPSELVTMVSSAASYITGSEARTILKKAFPNTELGDIDEEWVKLPATLALEKFKAENAAPGGAQQLVKALQENKAADEPDTDEE